MRSGWGQSSILKFIWNEESRLYGSCIDFLGSYALILGSKNSLRKMRGKWWNTGVTETEKTQKSWRKLFNKESAGMVWCFFFFFRVSERVIFYSLKEEKVPQTEVKRKQAAQNSLKWSLLWLVGAWPIIST